MPAEKPRSAKSGIGSSAEPSRRMRRREYATNTTSSTAPTATGIQSQAGQPSDWPSTSGTMNASTMALSSTTPTRSRRIGRGERVSGTNRAARAKIAMPTGMLMRKTVRQPSPQRSASMSQPPSTGPSDGGEAADAADEAVHRGALARAEERLHRREQLRHHERGEQPLRDAGGDERVARPGGGGRGGREGEPGDADEEHASSPEQVAQSAAGDERDREREHVAAHDPLELRLGCPEVGADRRQRDLHDRDVEEVHERGEQEDADGEAAAWDGGHARRPFVC